MEGTPRVNRTRSATLVALFAIVTAACGARLTDQQRQYALQAGLSAGTTSNGATSTNGGITGTGTAPGSKGKTGTPIAAGPGSSAGGSTTGGGGGGPSGGVGTGTSQQAQNNGGSTDTGVTVSLEGGNHQVLNNLISRNGGPGVFAGPSGDNPPTWPSAGT